MKQEVKTWLAKAEQDFETAKYNAQGNKLDAALFFLQQSAEKSLKALYIKRFNKLVRAHDLVLLARKLNAPQKIIEFCKELSPAYLYTRYPDVPSVNNLEKIINKTINFSEEIIKWVKKNI